MAKKKYAIKVSSLPSRSPLLSTAVLWLLLDRFAAPEWAYGVLWTMSALLVGAWLHSLFTTEYRDVPGFGERE